MQHVNQTGLDASDAPAMAEARRHTTGMPSDAVARLASVWQANYNRNREAAYRIVRNLAVAEECVSQAYLALHPHASELRDCGASLFVACQNAALDVLRKERGRAQGSKRTAVELTESSAVTDDSRSSTHGMLQWVWTLCNRKEREVLQAVVRAQGDRYMAAETLGVPSKYVWDVLRSVRMRCGVLRSKRTQRVTLKRSAHGAHDSYTLWPIVALALGAAEPSMAMDRPTCVPHWVQGPDGEWREGTERLPWGSGTHRRIAGQVNLRQRAEAFESVPVIPSVASRWARAEGETLPLWLGRIASGKRAWKE